MIEFEEFAKILSVLAALYPRFKLTPTTVEAYYAILGDLSADLLKAATLEMGGRDSPWFPSAGELRSLAFRLLEREDGLPSAGEAWAETLRLINLYEPPLCEDFSTPLVYDALQAIGGNRQLCMQREDHLFTDRARFIEAYNVFVQRRWTETVMLPQVREAAARLAAVRDVPQLEKTVNEMQ